MRIRLSMSPYLMVVDGSDLFASLLGRRIQIDEEVQKQPKAMIDLSDGMRIFG